MEIEANVIANSKKSSIQYIGQNKLKIKVKAKAENGKANKEVLELLSNAFGCTFLIGRGLKSKNKLIIADCSETSFLDTASKLK